MEKLDQNFYIEFFYIENQINFYSDILMLQ